MRLKLLLYGLVAWFAYYFIKNITVKMLKYFIIVVFVIIVIFFISLKLYEGSVYK